MGENLCPVGALWAQRPELLYLLLEVFVFTFGPMEHSQ